MKIKSFVNVCAMILCLVSFAQSQTEWVKFSENPILSNENGYVAEPAVLYDRLQNFYQMWYSVLDDGRYKIYYATSNNGLDWFNHSENPVLTPGTLNEWDGSHVRSSAVIYVDGIYKLYYIGVNSLSQSQIGLAISNDGIDWHKHLGNPILSLGQSGSWDAAAAYHPKVVYDGDIYFMWYAGSDGNIVQGGLANSSDGITWAKYPNNPVLVSGSPGSWDEYSVWPSSGVVLKDGKFFLLYTGVNYSNPTNSPIGLATSEDGVVWEKNIDNPILRPGSSGSWDHDGMGSASLIFDGEKYKLWYGAHSETNGNWQIGYAESFPVEPEDHLVFLPRVYGLPGDTVAVSLYADPVHGIHGGDFVLRFDPDVLTALETQATEFTEDFTIAANLDTPGVARISLASAYAAEGGLGGLVRIRMLVSPSLPAEDSTFSSSLVIASATLFDQDGLPLPVNTRDGEFVIGDFRGDVNGDGTINAADAILTLRIVAELLVPTPEQASAADFDGNGEIESFDASCILRTSVGLDCPTQGEDVSTPVILTISPFLMQAGNEKNVSIFISGMSRMVSGEMALTFDNGKLEILAIERSTETPNMDFLSNLNASGEAKFCFAAAQAFDTPILATLRLRAKAEISNADIGISKAKFFDSQARRWQGLTTAIDKPDSPQQPKNFLLEQNFPNPFSRSLSVSGLSAVFHQTPTIISYTIPETGHVTITVYDILGRRIRQLEDAEQYAGKYSVQWDGTDQNGAPVATGTYFYRLQAGTQSLTKKMLFIQ